MSMIAPVPITFVTTVDQLVPDISGARCKQCTVLAREANEITVFVPCTNLIPVMRTSPPPFILIRFQYRLCQQSLTGLSVHSATLLIPVPAIPVRVPVTVTDDWPKRDTTIGDPSGLSL